LENTHSPIADPIPVPGENIGYLSALLDRPCLLRETPKLVGRGGNSSPAGLLRENPTKHGVLEAWRSRLGPPYPVRSDPAGCAAKPASLSEVNQTCRLLDRIDIHIEVPAVKYKELRGEASSEDSAAVRERVVQARRRQMERFAAEKRVYANAQMPPRLIRKHCAISAEGEKLLENAVTRLGLSARAHDRILKVARTVADLDAAEGIEPRHLGEAIQYRTLDRTYWA
jgi:hypothetical protein